MVLLNGGGGRPTSCFSLLLLCSLARSHPVPAEPELSLMSERADAVGAEPSVSSSHGLAKGERPSPRRRRKLSATGPAPGEEHEPAAGRPFAPDKRSRGLLVPLEHSTGSSRGSASSPVYDTSCEPTAAEARDDRKPRASSFPPCVRDHLVWGETLHDHCSSTSVLGPIHD